jgi:hypothetical protein
MPILATDLDVLRETYPKFKFSIFKITLKTLQTEFEFLIQKLHRKSLYNISRKGRFTHEETNKIGFVFFDFSTIF